MNWYTKLKEIHDKGDRLRKQATEMGAKLGHRLEGWTNIQNCRCRKCGAYAKINGVFYDHDGKTFEGEAFTNPCNVNFSNGDEHEWKPYTNPWPANALTSSNAQIKTASPQTVHFRHPQFIEMFRNLPNSKMKNFVRSKFEQMVANPASVKLKPIFANKSNNVWSAQIGDHYRALAIKQGPYYLWYWIGPHETYTRVKDAPVGNLQLPPAFLNQKPFERHPSGEQYPQQSPTANKHASKMDVTRDLNEIGVPKAPAADLAVKLDGDEEFAGIMNDVRLLQEEKQWRKAMMTKGAKVRHDKEGWVGTVFYPMKDEKGHGRVGVEHEFTDGEYTIPNALRFYSPLELSPA